IAPGIPDGGGHTAQHPRSVGDFEPDGDAVARARGDRHQPAAGAPAPQLTLDGRPGSLHNTDSVGDREFVRSSIAPGTITVQRPIITRVCAGSRSDGRSGEAGSRRTSDVHRVFGIRVEERDDTTAATRRAKTQTE